jgi:hypothetical protein
MGTGKAVFFLCAMAASSIAHAQGIATSFNELRLLVRPGDTLAITSTAGPEVTGKLVDLSPGRLVVRVGEGQQEWREGDVVRIRQRRGDSLANGAWWGLGIGAGTALALGIVAYEMDDEPSAGAVAALTAIYGGMGAGIGAGVDALISKRVVIFERQSARTSLVVTPILSPGRKGALLSIGF